jgi:release factor glutamine methyltransferase
MPDDSLTAASLPAALTDAELAIAGRLRTAGCVFAEEEARLLTAAAGSPDEVAAMVDRRVAGLPLEHVVGWAEFCGLRVIVGPGVFVPRRRSEFLVRQAVAVARQAPAGREAAGVGEVGGGGAGVSEVGDGGAGVGEVGGGAAVVLDLCCGSGAVGLAVATALDGAELYAADIDPGATAYARRNLAAVKGHVYDGDLYDPLPSDLRGRIGLIVVNAPYVPTAEIGLMPPEARLHEPAVALDGGADGVVIHRRIAALAPEWLAPGGCLLIETSDPQAPLTTAAMVAAGLATTVAGDDDLDATVVIGRT